MKTQYYTASSLDGFIATAEHSLDWLLQFNPGDESSYPQFIQQVGALAMGSHTYEWILNHFSTEQDDPQPQTWPYDQPTWVFTSRLLATIPSADIRFVRGDVRPVFQEMKAAAHGKNLWIVGGGDLAGQFYDQGLLDELIIQVTPVTLGSGTPLFPRLISQPPLSLVSVQTIGSTFVELRYSVPAPSA